MRTAIYVRAQTDESLGAQRVACETKAREVGAGTVVVYEDRCNGDGLDRPGLTALREAVRGGEVDVVVVLSTDRLARQAEDLRTVLDEFSRCGVQTQNLD